MLENGHSLVVKLLEALLEILSASVPKFFTDHPLESSLSIRFRYVDNKKYRNSFGKSFCLFREFLSKFQFFLLI